MTEQWAFGGSPPADESIGISTLVEGSTFCLSGTTGDILPPGLHGLFFQDTRVLSRWQLRIDGHSLQPLTCNSGDPFTATYVCRARPRAGHADSTLLVQRRRIVGDGLREELTLENLGQEAAGCTVTLLVEADFADLFEVKENRVSSRTGRISVSASDGIRAEYRWMGQSRGVHVTADPEPDYLPNLLSFQAVVPARGKWTADLHVQPIVDDLLVTAVEHAESRPARQLSTWREQGLVVTCARPDVTMTFQRSQEDLGSLRIYDASEPDRAAVAAGAPWYMTLFGRDSLLSSWMALPVDRRLALGTLHMLAQRQGAGSNPLTEEQPGRIMHEQRAGMASGPTLGARSTYYGTADASALFVMLLDEARRWGTPQDEIAELLPAADLALSWIITHGDCDQDGFVEYRRATDRGLINQGWKDSWDGINFASGRLAVAPIALCEVQAYSYGAFRARARLAEAFGDTPLAKEWHDRAATLKTAFNTSFWLPESGYYAVALDADKRPVDSLTSNMGHCLWTGIIDEDRATAVAAQLLSPRMFNGWGIRTLAADMGAYNPISYHNGSVWPHDNAITVAGLARYGFLEQAQTVTMAILDAARAFGGRLPELFCGFDRSRFPEPVPYPTSCSPQAWAAAAPLLMLTSLLRLEPDLEHGRLALDPGVPDPLLPLHIEKLRVGDACLTIDVDREGCSLSGETRSLEVITNRRARPPLRVTAPSAPSALVDLAEKPMPSGT